MKMKKAHKEDGEESSINGIALKDSENWERMVRKQSD